MLPMPSTRRPPVGRRRRSIWWPARGQQLVQQRPGRPACSGHDGQSAAAAPSSSSRVGPWYSDRPVSISTSQSHTCSSSLRSCDDTSTVRPVPARPPMSARISRTPCGSRPLAGSSRISSSGITEQRGGDAQALLHPQRVAAVAVVAPVAQADGVEQRRDRGGVVAGDGGEHPQVLGAGTGRGRTPGSRSGRRPGAGRRPDRRSTQPSTVPVPDGGPDEAEQHGHGGGLAGAVRARRSRRRRPSAARCRGGRRRLGRRSAW